MKKMRKVAGMLMAATVAMAMPMSAMAANITVEKAVKGATYSAYRVFDYTKDDNGGYSYTISDTSPWYNVKVKSFAPRQIQRRLFAALVTLSRKVFRPWHKWF